MPAYPVKGIASDLPPLIPVSVAAERLKARNAAAAAGGEKVLVKKANVQLGEVDDEDTHKPETSGKKKKKVRVVSTVYAALTDVVRVEEEEVCQEGWRGCRGGRRRRRAPASPDARDARGFDFCQVSSSRTLDSQVSKVGQDDADVPHDGRRDRFCIFAVHSSARDGSIWTVVYEI